MEKDNAIKYSTLNPDAPDFALWLTLAWRWTQDRPAMFPESGGYDSLRRYLFCAGLPNRKQIGVFRDGAMLSLITAVMTEPGAYLFHITSPRKADAAAIACAVYEVGSRLFEQVKTGYIYTSVPTYGGHLHRGSKRIVEACGLTAYGEVEECEMEGRRYSWQPYALTYQKWREYHYGRKQDSKTTIREQ